MDIEYLIQKYNKLVYKICYDMLSNPHNAEDISQEVYLSLYKNFKRYELLPEEQIKNIICKIALNKCKDFYKSKVNRIQMQDLEEYEEIKDDNDLEEEIFLDEQKSYILTSVNELKRPYKQILIEYYINEKSLDEVANILNVSKPTLKTQLYRAKKILEERITSNKGGDFL